MNIDNIYNNIISQPEGTRFLKCDLHVHFIPPSSKESKFQDYCKELFEVLSKNRIDLVALTVHRQQDLEVLFKGIKNLRDLNRANTSSISIFPAIEVKDSSNTHFSIIFNKDIDITEISNLLGALGRKKEQENNDNNDQCDILEKTLSGDNLSIQKVLNEYKTVGFFPHALLADGVAKKITGESLKNYASNPLTFLWNLGSPLSESAIDHSLLSKKCPKTFTRTSLKFKEQQYFNDLARIKVSDAHDLELLDAIYQECPKCGLYENCNTGYTYLKLGDTTINAIKQVEYDSKTRVKYNLETTNLHSYIIGMYVKGEFFQKQYFRFNPELNVLVGGRGTGKSFIIDLLRFACNSIPSDEQYLKIFKSKLIKQLGNEGKVVFFFKDHEDNVISVKAVLVKDEKAKDLDLETEVTRTYYIKYQETPFLEIENIKDIFSGAFIEALSQTEIPRLHGKLSLLLNMIDSFEKDFPEKREREKLILEINDIKPKILKLYEQYEILNNKRNEFNDLSKKLNEKNEYLQKVKTIDLEKYQTILAIDSNLKNSKDAIESMFNSLKDTLNLKYDNKFFSSLTSESETVIKEIIEEFTEIEELITKFREQVTSKIEKNKKKIMGKFNNILEKWELFYSEKYKEYKELLAENDQDFIEAVQNEVMKIEIKVHSLEEDLKGMPEIVQKIGTMEEKIISISKQISRKSLEIHLKRLKISKNIEKKLNKVNINVKIKLRRLKGTKENEYYNWLNKIHKTKVENLLKKIQNKIFPYDLGEAIVNDTLDKYSKDFKVSHRKIFSKLSNLIENSTSPKIFDEMLIDLFTIYKDSKPSISFRRKITKNFHSLDRLSIGERCAVLLYIMSLVGDVPFLVDQADSELDQESTQKFSEFLLQIKGNRQVLVATHNPNIPTLGDVDLLYHLDTTPSENREIGGIVKSGGFENCIEAILELEGGREAIGRRFKKYNEKFFD